MTQDPLPQKIMDILITLADLGSPAFKTPKEAADMLEVMTAGVAILDAWAISRGLIKAPPVPDRAFDMARKMLGKILDAPGIGIWRSQDGEGWSASLFIARDSSSETHRVAGVTDAEVAAELAKEDAASGR